MPRKIFRNGDDFYEESKELIKRGEYSKARDVLVKSINKEGGVNDAAAVQVALIDLSSRMNDPAAYEEVVRKVDKLTSVKEFEFGLDVVNAADLKTECQLTARKMRLMADRGNPTMEDGKKLQDLAQDFQSQIGSKPLMVNTIFKKGAGATGESEFFNLMATSFEVMADATVFTDPSQAAEYQQIAAGYRQQNGQSAEENFRKVKEYSRTCTCWICGRVATGEGIHFYSAKADVSPSLKDGASSAAESRADTQHIYICRACYSAISNRADDVAVKYYQDCMKEMRAMEARLKAQIAAIGTTAAINTISNFRR